MENFIYTLDAALSSKDASHLIHKFEASTEQQSGRTGSGVDLAKKNSTDLYISTLPDWAEAHQAIFSAVQTGLLNYTRQFPMFLCSGIALSYNKAGAVKPLSHEDIASMADDELLSILKSVFVIEPINMQKYQKNVGGYFYWHSEQFPHPTDQAQRSLHRQLLFLVYLNDVSEGGETEYFYHDTKVTPKCGRLLISPCGFTHTHRGNAPLSHDKYVLASWISFRPAQQLYGA